jgi:hypothetical protein
MLGGVDPLFLACRQGESTIYGLRWQQKVKLGPVTFLAFNGNFTMMQPDDLGR